MCAPWNKQSSKSFKFGALHLSAIAIGIITPKICLLLISLSSHNTEPGISMHKRCQCQWYMCACMLSHFSLAWLFVILWTVAHQGPLSMGFPRQEYWSGLPCPSSGALPDPEIKPRSPALQEDSLPSEPPRKPYFLNDNTISLRFSFLILVNKYIL